MPEFVIEIKEVYIVKYKCTGESKEQILKDYMHPLFVIQHNLEALQEPIEYYCDADEEKPHRLLTMKEYNDENEVSDKAAAETMMPEVDKVNTYDPFEEARDILDDDDEFIVE